jgi:hypothetical protein
MEDHITIEIEDDALNLGVFAERGGHFAHDAGGLWCGSFPA